MKKKTEKQLRDKARNNSYTPRRSRHDFQSSKLVTQKQKRLQIASTAKLPLQSASLNFTTSSFSFEHADAFLARIADGDCSTLFGQFALANDELIYWARVRSGFWPVQVVPRNFAQVLEPTLDVPEARTDGNRTFFCLLFAVGRGIIMDEWNLVRFEEGFKMGIPCNVVRAALGDVLAFLREPRKIPPWTRITQGEKERIVPHMPRYKHIECSAEVQERLRRAKRGRNDAEPCNCGRKGFRATCVDFSCVNICEQRLCHRKLCLAGERCQNKIFSERNKPKVVPYQTLDGRGWGLRLTENVTAGSFIIEFVGEVIKREEYYERCKEAKFEDVYAMEIGNGFYIDPFRKGNLSRFINASCEPNCRAEKWLGNGRTHVGIFALMDMSAGTELTLAYGSFRYQNGDDSGGAFRCLCGESECRSLSAEDRLHLKKVLGKRISVRWVDGECYTATVERFNAQVRKFQVRYEDGNVELLQLGINQRETDTVKYEILP